MPPTKKNNCPKRSLLKRFIYNKNVLSVALSKWARKKIIFVCMKKKKNCRRIINKNMCTTNRFEISITSNISTANLKFLTSFCNNVSQQICFLSNDKVPH